MWLKHLENSLRDGARARAQTEADLAQCRVAGKRGDADAYLRAGALLARLGRVDEALVEYRRAIAAGRPVGANDGAFLLEKMGRLEEAIDWYRQANERGFVNLRRMVDLLTRCGRVDEAVDVLRQLTQVSTAAKLLERHGRVDEARDLYRTGARAGDTEALSELTRIAEASGNLEAELRLHRTAAERGDAAALRLLARMLCELGRVDEALAVLPQQSEGDQQSGRATLVRDIKTDPVYFYLWEDRRPRELHWAVRDLQQSQQMTRAIAVHLRAVEAGRRSAITPAAVMLEMEGYPAQALTLYWQAFGDGDRYAGRRIKDLLARREWSSSAAVAIAHVRAQTGDGSSLYQVSLRLRASGSLPEAIETCREAAEAGHRPAWRLAGRLMQEAGRTDEAIIWLIDRGDAGATDALRPAARLLREQGRFAEALTVYERATDAGDVRAARDRERLVRLLQISG
jgi:tetratricopeptide (TPR) repeat protein